MNIYAAYSIQFIWKSQYLRIFLLVLFCLTLNDSQAQETETYMNRAIAKLEFKSWEGALNDLNKTIKSDPLNAEAYYLRGVAHYFLQQYDLGVMDLDKAIDLKPDHAHAYYFRGRCRASMMQLFSSLADYRKVVALNPLNSSMFLYEAEENIF